MRGAQDHHPAQALARHHMPTGDRISLRRYTDRFRVRVPEDYGPEQSLHGFEDTYHNIVDYIVRITYRIWEERDVEYIRACYSDNSRVYDDFGLQIGNDKIVADTHHTTRAFPDIKLIADEVVWAGDDKIGFHTSHRTIIQGTNMAPSRFGPATERPIDILVIANCVSVENDIFLEHVLYNTGAMLAELGLDPMAEAERLVATPPAGWPRDAKTWAALRKEGGPTEPLNVAEPVPGFDPDAFVRDLHLLLWNTTEISVLKHSYSEAFFGEGPTNRTFEGREEYADFIAEIRAALPDLVLQVDEVYWMGNEDDGFVVSTRWSADAHHTGGGLYGAPTGAACQIWGITQQEIRAGRVEREWILFNEFDLMMQIAAAWAAS